MTRLRNKTPVSSRGSNVSRSSGVKVGSNPIADCCSWSAFRLMLLSVCSRSTQGHPLYARDSRMRYDFPVTICSAESAQSPFIKDGREPSNLSPLFIDTQLAFFNVRRQTLELSSSCQGRNLVSCQFVPFFRYPRRYENSPLVSFLKLLLSRDCGAISDSSQCFSAATRW